MAECDRHRFSGLELLPTPMLEKIIEQDATQEAEFDQELIDYVLTLLVQRAKSEDANSIPDIQSSWIKLQKRLESEPDLGVLPIPISTAKSKSTPRGNRFLRFVAVVAAGIALMLGAMITVQAMGVDVFGMLAKWTDDTFRFEPIQATTTKTKEYTEYNEEPLGEIFYEMSIPGSLMPTWVPEDYELDHVGQGEADGIKGIYATFAKPNCSNNIVVEINEFSNISLLTGSVYEKSYGDPEIYTGGTMQFYIFKNSETWTATWSDARYCITIAGVRSKENIKSIINSIPECNYE